MDVSHAKHLRELGKENSRLKRLLAEAELDKAALKELLSKSGEATDGSRCYAIWWIRDG
jgi:hypothetical protein